MPGAKRHYRGREILRVDTYRLKELRMLKGLTQDGLSKVSGVKYGYISYLEKHDDMPINTEALEALCRALECSPSDIAVRRFYMDPAADRARVTNFKDHRSVDLSIFGIGRKYLINGKKLILDEKSAGKGVIHFVFRQVSTGWLTCYTDIDFYVGDVSVQPL